MATKNSSYFNITYFLSLALAVVGVCQAATCIEANPTFNRLIVTDVQIAEFAQNFQWLEGEFWLHAALGYGFDVVAPQFVDGGPRPIGARKANLDPLNQGIIAQLGLQEAGNLRATRSRAGGFPRPLLNLSKETFAKFFDMAVGYPLIPKFDPYANSINCLLASYLLPYVGLVGAVGAFPLLTGSGATLLVAKLLAIEAGQDAVLRTLLYQKKDEIVQPYNFTVADFTNKLSDLNNRLAGCGIRDEGLTVPLQLGAENKTTNNILAADANSLAYQRGIPQLLSIFYGTGSASKPGGFFPNGASGALAQALLI